MVHLPLSGGHGTPLSDAALIFHFHTYCSEHVYISYEDLKSKMYVNIFSIAVTRSKCTRIAGHLSRTSVAL